MKTERMFTITLEAFDAAMDRLAAKLDADAAERAEQDANADRMEAAMARCEGDR